MIRSLTFTFLLSILATVSFAQAKFTAVFDGPLPGGQPKGIEILLTQDIADLSMLGIAIASNGGGASDTAEFVLSGAGLAGDYIHVTSDLAAFTTFIGFDADLEGPVFINGDDALELFMNDTKIDVFGDVNVDGSGEAWEYLDGWAFRNDGTGPDGSTFVIGNWTFSGPNALDGETTNATAVNPIPLNGGVVIADHIVLVSNFMFSPDVLVVDQGDVVEFSAIDGTHNVNGSLTTFPGNVNDFFSGPAEAAPWTFQHTFSNVGHSDFQCDPHAGGGMVGTVMVREEGDYHVNVENNFFTPADITIEKGESIVWTNVSGFHNVNGTVDTYANNPASFFSGAAGTNWTFKHTFDTAGVYEYQCDPHAVDGMTGTITVKDLSTFRGIFELRVNDADGISNLINTNVKVIGVVHGVNLRPAGLQFSLIDENENTGVGVFLGSGDLGYTYAEGDLIEMDGVVGQFNGLTQLAPTAISLFQAGVGPRMPDVVTELNEISESALVRLNGLTLVDPSEWPSVGSSANVNATDGTNNFTIRIDNDVDAGEAPSGLFDIIGLGGQFDNSIPYSDGYQLLPRYESDVIKNVGINSLEDLGIYKIAPNPTSDFVKIESEEQIERLKLVDITGKVVIETEVRAFSHTLDLSGMNSGNYILIFSTAKGHASSMISKK